MTRRERRSANDVKRRIAIPSVFPITFAYVPVSFVDDDVVLGPDMLAVGNATYYHFGVLSSAMHVAWLCAVDRPKGTEFVYRPERAYNTFAWPQDITDEQRERIESAARLVEQTRDSIPGFSFAAHYTVDGMPPALKEAHRVLDEAVFAAYGLRPGASGPEIVLELKMRYDELAANAKPDRIVRDRPRHSGLRPSSGGTDPCDTVDVVRSNTTGADHKRT